MKNIINVSFIFNSLAFCRRPSTAFDICDLTAVRFDELGDGVKNFLTPMSAMLTFGVDES